MTKKQHSSYWINLNIHENPSLCEEGYKKKGWMEIRINNRVYAVPRAEASIIRNIIAKSGIDMSDLIAYSSNELAKILSEARNRSDKQKVLK